MGKHIIELPFYMNEAPNWYQNFAKEIDWSGSNPIGKSLEKFNGKFWSTETEDYREQYHLEFDTESDAIYFILRWSQNEQ